MFVVVFAFLYIFLCICVQDPASSTGSEADSDTREGEPVTINYKPSPLQMKIGEPAQQFLSKVSDIIMLRSAWIQCHHSDPGLQAKLQIPVSLFTLKCYMSQTNLEKQSILLNLDCNSIGADSQLFLLLVSKWNDESSVSELLHKGYSRLLEFYWLPCAATTAALIIFLPSHHWLKFSQSLENDPRQIWHQQNPAVTFRNKHLWISADSVVIFIKIRYFFFFFFWRLKCCWYPYLCVCFAEKQRELARKGSLKNGNAAGSPVNQQPKKNNVMARTRWERESGMVATWHEAADPDNSKGLQPIRNQSSEADAGGWCLFKACVWDETPAPF